MTAAGDTGSPRSEVMAFSGDPVSAIGQWINSVYHRTPLLSPWLQEMGYGMTADCDTIDMGQGKKSARRRHADLRGNVASDSRHH